MDASAIKATQRKVWSTMAAGWRKHDATFRRQTAPVSERIIANLEPGQHVLDIASGVGDPAIQAAERVGPTGRVLAGDLVEEMVAFARESAAARGLKNIEFRVTDGEELDAPPGAFDAVTMRFGLMFMPNPLACLQRCHAALKPGGTIALSCWCGPDKNAWAAMPMGILKKYLELPASPPGTPGLFQFADREALRSALASAGFTDIAIDPVELTMADFATGDEFVAFTLDTAGPIAMAFNKLSDEQKPQVAAEIGNEAVRIGGGRAHIKGLTWVATARR
jgi:enediyne biosynthesis protein CalE5